MDRSLLARLRTFAIGFILFAVSGQAHSLIINATFAGGTAHASSTGTGNLQSIFGAAADWWEAAIQDPFTLNLTYQWGSLSVLGSHSLTAQAGGRETAGTITFDNDGSTDWWLDATPFDASEFSTFTAYQADLGGGLINTGRVYTGGIGDAGTDFDLFNSVIHEIGHSLGMSSANLSFQSEARQPGPGDSDIDVTIAGFAGTILAVRSTTAHYLSTGDTAQASLGRIVSRGSRHMLSCVDILGNAQISGFTNFNCDPDNPSVSVPEPGLLTLVGIGLAGMAWTRRRKRLVG